MYSEDVQSKYNGQKMKEVVGRTSDVVALSNGHKLTTSGFNSLFRTFNVDAFRIKKVGDFNIIFSNSDIIIKGEEDLKKLSSYIMSPYNLCCTHTFILSPALKYY